MAIEIRKKINAATNLTCSAGMGSNKMIAKICSDINKPNGQFSKFGNALEIEKWISEMDVRKIPGIGRMRELVLNNLGMYKCKDVILNAEKIFISFGKVTANQLISWCLGIA